MDWRSIIHKTAPGPQLEPLNTGDDVRVWYKIREGKKDRIVPFEGVILRVRGAGASRTFTVRRLTQGIGVERSFPFNMNTLDRVEVLRHGKTKRSRIYFLRTVVKATRLATVDKPRSVDLSSKSKKKSDSISNQPSGSESLEHTQKQDNAMAATEKSGSGAKQKA